MEVVKKILKEASGGKATRGANERGVPSLTGTVGVESAKPFQSVGITVVKHIRKRQVNSHTAFTKNNQQMGNTLIQQISSLSIANNVRMVFACSTERFWIIWGPKNILSPCKM